jgi:hypothetical protein
MSVRRVAVLLGSHDHTYFAPYERPDTPSEAAALTALRAQRSTGEASHRAVTETPPDHGLKIGRHAGASADAGTWRGHAHDSVGPPRTSAFAATARTRRTGGHMCARLLAGLTRRATGSPRRNVSTRSFSAAYSCNRVERARAVTTRLVSLIQTVLSLGEASDSFWRICWSTPAGADARRPSEGESAPGTPGLPYSQRFHDHASKGDQ